MCFKFDSNSTFGQFPFQLPKFAMSARTSHETKMHFGQLTQAAKAGSTENLQLQECLDAYPPLCKGTGYVN